MFLAYTITEVRKQKSVLRLHSQQDGQYASSFTKIYNIVVSSLRKISKCHKYAKERDYTHIRQWSKHSLLRL